MDDIKISRESLYTEYSSSHSGHQREHGDEKSSFLQTFLRKQVGEKDEKDVHSDTQLMYGFQMAKDNPRKKKKTLKHPVRKLNARERRKLSLHNITKEARKYEDYEPLHRLWLDHVNDLLDLKHLRDSNKADAETKLLKADLHGSLLKVTKTKCPTLIGLSGILLQETKNTFKVITKENVVKTLPKEGSVFTTNIQDYVFTIYGRHFVYRARDRAARRFKIKDTIDL